MDATYVDVNEFTVATDRTSEFITGRRIKANCGVNGIKYCTVLSSAFGATTAVITKESELTANLVTVLYGIVEPRMSGSLPDHYHTSTEGDGGLVIENTAYGAGWNGDTTHAPTQNAVYDEMEVLRAYPESGNFDARVKGWIQFNGQGVIAIQDSFNVDTITDEGVGAYTVVWDIDFATDDYAAIPSSSTSHAYILAITAGTILIYCVDNTHSVTDPTNVYAIAIGGQ